MKKSELKSGMVVRFREGDMYLVVEVNGEYVCVGKDGWNRLKYYKEDLRNDLFESLDIVEVYDPQPSYFGSMISSANRKPIWKREPKKKMTVSQIEKELGYEIEIVRGV